MKTRLTIEKVNLLIPKKSWLTALYYLEETIFFGKTKRTAAVFQCKCGGKITANPHQVITCQHQSCGCFKYARRNRKYNSYNPKLRRVYYSMISRCHHENDKVYKYYGGRGVKVCIEWRRNPQKFFDWAINNGYQEGLELDKDIKGGKIYSPKNCLWVTKSVNIAHRRKRSKAA